MSAVFCVAAFLFWLVLAAKSIGTDPMLFGGRTNRCLKNKGNNKMNTIDQALSSKKEVEELEKQLLNKKAIRDAAKKLAKEDLEWILKEENNLVKNNLGENKEE